MLNRVGGMTVDMKVLDAVAMPVLMEVHALAPQPPQHMRAQPDEHDADCSFQRTRQMFGNSVTKQNRGTGEHEKRQGVPQSPGQTVFDDVADIGAPGSDAGHRRNMIGLERVLHSENEAKSQNSEHTRHDLV